MQSTASGKDVDEARSNHTSLHFFLLMQTGTGPSCHLHTGCKHGIVFVPVGAIGLSILSSEDSRGSELLSGPGYGLIKASGW